MGALVQFNPSTLTASFNTSTGKAQVIGCGAGTCSICASPPDTIRVIISELSVNSCFAPPSYSSFSSSLVPHIEGSHIFSNSNLTGGPINCVWEKFIDMSGAGITRNKWSDSGCTSPTGSTALSCLLMQIFVGFQRTLFRLRYDLGTPGDCGAPQTMGEMLWYSTYYVFSYDAGSHAPVLNETINVIGEASETAVVHAFTNSGGWSGSGTGTITVRSASANFRDNLLNNDGIEDSGSTQICTTTTGASTTLTDCLKTEIANPVWDAEYVASGNIAVVECQDF